MSSVDVTTQDLIKRIEDGIMAAQTSEGFKDWLALAGKFHQYSFGNIMLIAFQRPDATRVAGFHKWLELGRHVRRGEHGLKILAPCVGRKVESEDEDDGERVQHSIFFKPVTVFDISQTEGEDLPSPVKFLAGDEITFLLRLQRVAALEGISLSREPGAGRGANGFYNWAENKIWIAPGLEPVMAARTLAHELGHYYARHSGETEDTREERETVAEAVAYIVMNHFGIDAGDYTFGYIASWADVKTFRSKLTEIQKAASAIITALAADGKNGFPSLPPAPEPVTAAAAIPAAEPEPLLVFKRRPHIDIDESGTPVIHPAAKVVVSTTVDMPASAETDMPMPFYGHVARQLPSRNEDDYRLAANELKARESGAYESAVTAAKLAASKPWALKVKGYKGTVTLLSQSEVERNHRRGLDAYGFSAGERADFEARLAKARAGTYGMPTPVSRPGTGNRRTRNREVELMAA